MKLVLAVYGLVCMFETFGLGWVAGEGKGQVVIPAWALFVVGLLVLTALQFRAVTSPDRSSKFVRIWAAWQPSSPGLFLGPGFLATQFVPGRIRNHDDVVLRWAAVFIGALLIAGALGSLWRLLRRNPPIVLHSSF